jgi:protocatechuate 3,4-dioxygenase beta subunit
LRQWCLFTALAASAACAPHHPQQSSVDQEEPPRPVAPLVPVPEPLHLDRRADAAASVAGTIVDQVGQPLTGAHVCAWNVDPNADDRTPRCTETDATGAYVLSGLTPTRHELHASAAERQPVGHPEPLSLRPGEHRAGVDLRLAPGGTPVRGVVRDARGQAIAGAWVSNFDHDRGEQAGPRGAAAIQTDAGGAFTLWLSPGSHGIVARARDFVSGGIPDATAPGRYSLALDRASTLSGRVVDMRTGAPVAGARVTVTAPDTQQRAGLAFTDADGRYRLEGLPPGLYKPRAVAPGRRGEAPRTVHVAAAAESSSPELALHPAASVSARLVVTGAGQTCSQGQVMLQGTNEVVHVESAGPDGEVFFPALPPGTYYVVASCPGAAAPPSVPEIEVGTDPVRGVVWEFAAGRSIHGVIVDPRGQPLVGAIVRASVARDCAGECPPRSAAGLDRRGNCQTDDQCAMDEICDNGTCVFSGMAPSISGTSQPSDPSGRFVIAGLPPGNYEVSSELPRMADTRPAWVQLGDADAESVRVVGSTLARVGGVVIDDRGAPRVGEVVDILVDHGTYLAHVSSTRTDEDGRFTLFDVEAGDYRVRVRSSVFAANGHLAQPQPGDVRTRVEGAAPTEVEIKAPAPILAQIRGQVRGPDGAPLSDVVVKARLETSNDESLTLLDQPGLSIAEWTASSDAAGTFVLSGLTAGAYTLRADRGGGVAGVSREHVRTGSKVALTVPPTVTVAGRLTGAPLDKFTLRVTGHDNDIVRTDTFERTRGRWAFEGLPPGTYEIHCEDTTLRGQLVVTLGKRSLDALELPLARPGDIEGRIVEAGTRRPLAGLQVTVVPEGPALRSAPWSTETITDERGRFAFAGLPPGRLTLKFPAYVPGELTTTVESGRTVEVWPTLRLAPR